MDAVHESLRGASARQIVKRALQEFGKDLAISFSGAEDVLLIEYASQLDLPYRVFALDTGRLHPETYRFFGAVEKHYEIKIEYFFPQAEAVQDGGSLRVKTQPEGAALHAAGA